VAGPLPRGRGRLSSLNLLPAEAEEDVAWAFAELNRRKLTQQDILEQLNLRLKLKGLSPISSSAFNRAAIRTARMAHRLGEVKEIAAALAEKFEDGGNEQLTVLAAEIIKTAVFEVLESASGMRATPMTAEMLANFALAVKSAEQAKKVSADMKVLIEKSLRTQTEQALDKVKGITPEMRDEFKRKLFGIADGK